MIEWLMSNKEWIFSGLGIAVISALFAIIKTKIPKNTICIAYMQFDIHTYEQ